MEENNQGFEIPQAENVNDTGAAAPKVGDVIGADGFSEKDKKFGNRSS